jgi:hypothetical protein
MPGICDGLWINSRINGVDDGTIQINEGLGGILGGRHNKSTKGIFGICTNGTTPHVAFVRFDNGATFIYQGDIKRVPRPDPHFEIENGFVTVVRANRATKPLADDWTAEKHT